MRKAEPPPSGATASQIAAAPRQAPVLVCGLGALGQAVLIRLLSFGTPLRALDLRIPDWRTPQLQQALQDLLCIGDMRKPHVLRQVGVEKARAVLLLSSDSSVNFEAALQVRLLNDTAEIVVRSSSDLDDLGSLLEQRLPRLAVVNPVQLSAGALVQALRPGRQLARFEVRGESFEVTARALEDQCFQRPVRLEGGEDSLIVMPMALASDRTGTDSVQGLVRWRSMRLWLQRPQALTQRLILWYRQRSRLLLALLVLVLLMAVVGIRLFAAQGGWVQGLFVTSAQLKGDYVDPTNVLLGAGSGPRQADAGLISLTLLYSFVGTLLSSALVAVILDQLLMARLGMRQVRRIQRQAKTILLVGGGQLAVRVAQELRRERFAVVRIESEDSPAREDDPSLRVTSLEQAETLLRGRPACAVALLSGGLLSDLRDTLRLQDRWPSARFALLALSEGLGERLGDLLGGASLISPIELGADVVVASAFGERVEAAWRIEGRNLLQVRYHIAPSDSLLGHTVSRLDHGFGLTVLCLTKAGQSSSMTMPPPGTLVAEGDELVVLASLPALLRVERGELFPPALILSLELPPQLGLDLKLTLQQILARHLGVSPADIASRVLNQRTLRLPVDPDSGGLLLRDLKRQGFSVNLHPA